VKRRAFLKLAGAAATAGASATKLFPSALPLQGMLGMPPTPQDPNAAPAGPPADFTLKIAPVQVELAPRRAISTIGYNGTSPGPVLRMREGKPVTVDVINDTDVPEFVHWHGQLVSPEVDGAEEEGTPPVPPRGRRRYQFTPRPAGARWYHSHAMSGDDLHRGTYTGQFGFVFVEGANNPGNYDQELFLALRDWEPFFSDEDTDDNVPDPNEKLPEAPPTPDTRPNGWEIGYRIFSINDKSLGGGDPIRVRPGQRVLMHILNASATANRRIALPGHVFEVLAMDGNPVPTPKPVAVLEFGPGERIDALVTMNQPGVWILGATRDSDREDGLGVLIEYASQHADKPWLPPPPTPWDYTIFGKPAAAPKTPDETIEMLIEKIAGGPGKFNQWTINGKQYPHEGEFTLRQGGRYRLVFRNKSDDAHPVHLHRHLFEIVEINGKRTGGIMKDTVVVPMYGRVAVDFVADQPGLTLFHCHNQIHMDFGFKALFRYS
jgi:FtsP/CotA-like multicopper oxidase with cupredoxin domain